MLNHWGILNHFQKLAEINLKFIFFFLFAFHSNVFFILKPGNPSSRNCDSEDENIGRKKARSTRSYPKPSVYSKADIQEQVRSIPISFQYSTKIIVFPLNFSIVYQNVNVLRNDQDATVFLVVFRVITVHSHYYRCALDVEIPPMKIWPIRLHFINIQGKEWNKCKIENKIYVLRFRPF